MFHQFQETTGHNAPALSTMQGDSEGGDVYSAFRALEPIASSTQPMTSEPRMGDATHAPKSDFTSDITFPPPAFNSGSTSPLSSRVLPTVSDSDRKSQTSTVPVTSGSTENNIFGLAFPSDSDSQSVFGNKSSGSTGLGSQQKTLQPTDNWGDFTSFSDSEWSQPVTSSTTLPSSSTTTLSLGATPVWPQPSSITTTNTTWPSSSSATTWPFPSSSVTANASVGNPPSSDTTSSTMTFPLLSTTSDTTKEPSPAGFMDDFSEFSGYSSPQETQLAPANGSIERDSSVLSQVSSMSSSSQILEPQTKVSNWKICAHDQLCCFLEGNNIF